MNKDSICTTIRQAEQNYTRGVTQIGDYVSFSMYDTIQRIIAYINSRHTSGDKDSLGRDKPFFNIIIAAINIWYRATDIDRKDIIIRSDKASDYIATFLATIKLREWMRHARFGVFLNLWGRALSQYGSAVVKFVEKDGELNASVVSWQSLIVDPINFDSIPTIEKFYKTPAELRQMKDLDQDMVENLCSAETTRKNLRGQQVDNKSGFIELYEVHGMLPVALLKEDPTDDDWKEYRQQMHIVSFTANNKVESGYDNYSLYKGKEKKHPYMLTHLIEEDGRTLAIGAVEALFDAQWMQNHTIKNMKDTLDLSSKLIFQTADANYVNRNVLSAIEVGDILIHADEKPLTQINTTKPDVTALINFSNQWTTLAQEISATPESLRGINPPSGTPYSTTALLAGQANSLFEIMTENKGHHIEDMLREYIIPFLKTQLDTKDEIMAVLEDYDLQKFDSIYVPKRAIANWNRKVINDVLNNGGKDVLSGAIPSPYANAQNTEQQSIKDGMAPMGNHRPISPENLTWNEVFKDLEWNVEVGVTNEPVDKQMIFQTLNTILQTIAGNPMILQDPNAKMIFGKILSYTGAISPIELSTAQAAPPPPLPLGQPAQPQMGGSRAALPALTR